MIVNPGAALCYTSTTLLVLTFFDSTRVLCISYLSVSSSADYSSLHGNSAVPTNSCSACGDVRNAATTMTSAMDVENAPRLRPRMA
jgi:hypothetical protein